MEKSLNQSRTTGVVIPAYNEAKNLPHVLNTVCTVEWLQEIIVVDDGSTDATFEAAQRFAEHDRRLAVVRLPENKGKAAAMLTGVQALHTDLIIFLDADLVGLKPVHLQQLANLQKSGSCEMAIALFQIGRSFTNVSQRFIPQLSGQRCLWRLEAEQALIPSAADRYGVEVGLTIHARREHWLIRKTIWHGVTHHMAWRKRKMIPGLYSRLQMYRQIMVVLARNRRSNRRRIAWLRPVRKIRLTLR